MLETSKKQGRIHRMLRWLAVPLLVVLMALTALPDPAGAYTIEYPDAETVVIHSARLDVRTIHATMHVAIYRTGQAQWWADVHNGGRVGKLFNLRCTVKWATIYKETTFATGDLDIDGKRKGGVYETFHGTSPGITGEFFDLLVRDGFQVNCNLHNDSVF